MLSQPVHLSPDGLGVVIALCRQGADVSLVCHRPLDYFSPATIYPVHKIVGGNAIELIDDGNEPFTLTEDCPVLGCFLIGHNRQEAEAIASRIKHLYVNDLSSRVQLLMAKNEFKVGQVVQWKPGMQVCTLPSPNQPAVVVEILSAPIDDGDNHMLLDPLRTLRCDMMIAFDSADEGILVTTYADSRRFEPYPHQGETLHSIAN